MNRSFAGAHHFLGVAFLQKHQTGQARAAFTEAVKFNPILPEPAPRWPRSI